MHPFDSVLVDLDYQLSLPVPHPATLFTQLNDLAFTVDDLCIRSVDDSFIGHPESCLANQCPLCNDDARRVRSRILKHRRKKVYKAIRRLRGPLLLRR